MKLNPQNGLRPGVSRFLSIAGVAVLLDVSQKTVRRWIKAGELPVHHLGRQLRVSETDLTAFLARSRRGGL